MLIEQRSPHQCAIATIAMATGADYDEILRIGTELGSYVEGEGCRSYQGILKGIGLDGKYENGEAVGEFVCLHRDYAISAEYFRLHAWGRRAIMTVPSLNKEGGHHSIYWDGREVLDPNPPSRKRYSKFTELLPSEMILFREAA